MDIERRQGAAARNNLRRPGETAHQLHKRRAHLQDHARAARGDQRRIAAEMDRIAEALLAVQQDGLAGDVALAQPQRLRKIALRRRHVGLLPAPLIFEKAPREIAGEKPHQGLIAMRDNILRQQRQRARRTGEGLVIAIELFEDLAAIVERVAVIRPQRQQLVITGERLVEPFEIMQGVAAIVERVGIVGPQRERAIVIRQGFGGPFDLVQDHAALVEQLRIVRSQGDRPGEGVQRLVIAFEFGERDAAVGDRLDQRWQQGQRAVIACQRFLIAPQLAQGIAAIAMRLDQIGRRAMAQS